MKRLLSSLTVMALVLVVANMAGATGSSSSSGYNTPIYTPALNFRAGFQSGTNKIETSWDVYAPSGFNYYKVIRSTSNPDPVYPDDGYIQAISDANTTSYLDAKPPTGIAYYRVCSIVKPDRYCSNVVTVDMSSLSTSESSTNDESTSNDSNVSSNDDNEPYPSSEQWQERCRAWNGTIDSNNNCTWSGGLWCDRWALYDGDCLDIFAKYYDPRTNPRDDSNDDTEPQNTDDITGHNYATAIWYLKNKGVVQGYTDGTFRPDNTINRAEFIKIVMEAIYPGAASGNDCFNDVSTEWFAPYICAAKNKELVNGFGDGGFHPYQTISMAEAAKIVMEALGMTPDSGPDSNWYGPYMRVLSNNKYIPQTVMNTFQHITRGEMAELIWRAQEGVDYMPAGTYSE